jgi:competence protein ComEC
LLVDAGGRRRAGFDPGERVVVPHLLARGGRRVEALILTHGHVDHAGGAFALLRDLEVGELWVGPGYHRSRRLLALVETARERGTALVLAEAGVRTQIAELPLRVVAPSREAAAYAENDASVVVILGRAPRRLLVPGDLEREGELALARSAGDLRSELLVVSHHGSRHGSTQAFLARVQPRWALVSAGRRNAFGHPHGEVVRRFRSMGVPLLRTDVLGPVKMRGSATGWIPGGGSPHVDRNQDE